MLQVPLLSVLQSCTHNFPLQIICSTPVAFDKIEFTNGTLGVGERDDPVLLLTLAGVLSDPENPSLPQELGKCSSLPQSCSLVYFG